jgi:hypothetical protein
MRFEGTEGWLGRRWRSVAGNAEFRVFDGGKRKTPGSDAVRRSEGEVEAERRNGCGVRKHWVSRQRREVVAALRAVLFRCALDGHEIVADGDYREQDRDEHRNGDDLAAPVVAGRALAPEPSADHQQGESSPSEIEQDFHLSPSNFTAGKFDPIGRILSGPRKKPMKRV